jgi:hypothetical protein
MKQDFVVNNTKPNKLKLSTLHLHEKLKPLNILKALANKVKDYTKIQNSPDWCKNSTSAFLPYIS